MQGRIGIGERPGATATLTRLTFITPDGAEHEFRDQLTGGAPNWNAMQSMPWGSQSIGRVFVSDDASDMTFISDTNLVDPPYNSPDCPQMSCFPYGSDSTFGEVFSPSGYLFMRSSLK